MPEIIKGPVFCPICIHTDITKSPCLQYSMAGDGFCNKCGYKYKAGTEWVLEIEDLEKLMKDLKDELE